MTLAVAVPARIDARPTKEGRVNAHPAANLFPLMGEQELADLAADIRAHGQHEAITTYQGMVLDGRNRLRACEMIGVSPRFVEWDGSGGSPTDFVVSLNLHRRHLTASQLALIAADSRALYEAEAREARLRGNALGGKSPSPMQVTSSEAVPVETAVRAAEAFGISTSSVYGASRLKREAPDLAEKVADGKTSVQTALREIDGTRRKRQHIPDKHKELVKRADSVAQLAGRWERSMTDTLAPPQARKQLTVLNKAAALIAEAIEAVEYRATTLQMYSERIN